MKMSTMSPEGEISLTFDQEMLIPFAILTPSFYNEAFKVSVESAYDSSVVFGKF